MSDVDNLLDLLEREVHSSDRYELSSYEMEGAFEVEEHLVGKRGYPRSRARQLAAKAMKRPEIYRKLKSEMGANKGQGLIVASPKDVGSLAAMFTMKVQRNSVNIAGSLPVALFGTLDSDANYQRFVTPPAGVTLAVSIGQVAGQPNAARFTYTQGANVDTIDVTCQQAPYPSFLNSLSSDTLRMSKLRLSISDSTQQAQFSESIAVKTASLFGRQTQNTINPSSFKRPDQFQAGIIDLDGIYDVDKETAFVFNMIDVGAANFSVSIDFFAEAFTRYISK